LRRAKVGPLSRSLQDVISGGTTKRPAFDRMLTAASQKKFDLLLFWKLDRLSRAGVQPTLRLLQQLDEWGVAYRSYMESYLDSCGMMRDTVISIMATIAQQEKIAISDRTKAGLRRAVRQGKTLGRPRIDVDLAAVRKMRSAGHSLRAIGAKLGCSHATIIEALKAA